MNDEQDMDKTEPVTLLQEIAEFTDLVKKFTNTSDRVTALHRLTWIENMIKRRADKLKISYHGGPGETLESIFHEYDKREKYYSEFKEYSLSLIKAVELMVMYGAEPGDEEQAFQFKTILSTIRGAYEDLSLWQPGDEFPCEF